jgi:hypothetical protein
MVNCEIALYFVTQVLSPLLYSGFTTGILKWSRMVPVNSGDYKWGIMGK